MGYFCEDTKALCKMIEEPYALLVGGCSSFNLARKNVSSPKDPRAHLSSQKKKIHGAVHFSPLQLIFCHKNS